MNVLAIVIPHSDRHTGDYTVLNFPLGLAYIIGVLRQQLPEANIYIKDFSIGTIIEEHEMKGKLLDINKRFKPDYIMYDAMITQFTYIKILSRLLKDIFPKSRQVLGGSAAGSGYNYFLRDGVIDYFIIGEGEIAIVDILKGNYRNNSSVVVKENKKDPERQIVNDLDSLPFPSYKDFMIEEYVKGNYDYTGWRYMPMITQRGCPYSCNFCYSNFGKVVRNRDVDLVIEEMALLKSDHNIDSIYFWDEVQFLNKGWMEKFCLKLIDKKIDLKWTCSSRASLLQEKDMSLLRLAKRAGCLRITIGIESGNQGVLDRINKRNSVDQIENALRRIRNAGIKASGSMLVGYVGENEETIQDSIDFANRNLLKTSFYCLIPLPGSEIYRHCLKNELIKNEVAYLEKVSLLGGDASHIGINLTDMDDITYEYQIKRANALVANIKLRDILNYYGVIKGLLVHLKLYYLFIKLKTTKRMFETP